MRFLEYLFFKYYYFQVRVGNGDSALFSAVVFLSLVFSFVFADIISFYYFFIPASSPEEFNPYSIMFIFIIAVLVFSFLFFRKKRYEKVLKVHEAEWKGKKNIGAVLFAVIPFLLYFAELFISLKFNP